MSNTTHSITLLPLNKQHAPAMLRWMLEPEVAENIGLRSQPTLERTIDWIERSQNDSSTVAMAIEFNSVHVGNVILDRIDQYLATARLSIYIGDSQFRGMKIGQKSLDLAAKHAFSTMNLHKIWLTVHQYNSRAIAAYRAAGFEIEGTLRDEFFFQGKRCNALVMGLLRSNIQSEKNAA
jgi:RimJ/RimL family protein N-acetyltransferase